MARVALITFALLVAVSAAVPAVAEDVAALLRRAEGGDARAAFVLGMRYARQDSASRDDAEAVRWLRVAADEGFAEAQYNLGIMYAGGRGVPRDAESAVHWYTLAAEQGLASAQYNLGAMYAVGDGVPRDGRQAAVWFERAAEQDVPEAAYNLGVLYDLGRGVDADPETAVHWYARAAARGYHPAASRLAALRASNPRLASEAPPEADDRPPAAGLASSATRASAAQASTTQASATQASVTQASTVATEQAEAVVEPPAPGTSAEPRVERSSVAPPRSASPWLARLNPRHYTIQVLSHTDEASVRRYLRDNFREDEAGYFAFELDGETWFSVVTGDFPTYAQATAAGTVLAERIHGLEPWVRKVAIIQKVAVR